MAVLADKSLPQYLRAPASASINSTAKLRAITKCLATDDAAPGRTEQDHAHPAYTQYFTQEVICDPFYYP
jgi:hypothetical protein